jgi:hypothetical protein
LYADTEAELIMALPWDKWGSAALGDFRKRFYQDRFGLDRYA